MSTQTSFCRHRIWMILVLNHCSLFCHGISVLSWSPVHQDPEASSLGLTVKRNHPCHNSEMVLPFRQTWKKIFFILNTYLTSVFFGSRISDPESQTVFIFNPSILLLFLDPGSGNRVPRSGMHESAILTSSFQRCGSGSAIWCLFDPWKIH
jgi:hypothetical protein